MGRILSSENTVLSPQFINMTAGDVITAGNLLTIRADGKVYPAPTSSVPANWLNNTSQKSFIALSTASVFDSTYSSSAYQFPSYSNVQAAIGISGTEYTCVLFCGDGTTSTNNLYIKTLSRNNTISTSLLKTYSSMHTQSGMLDLGNSTILIFYRNPFTSYWEYEIRDVATHAVIKSTTTVSTNANVSGNGAINFALLSNGNIAIAYSNTSNAAYYQIISNTGVSVLAQTAIATVTTSDLSITSGGGYFVITYQASSTTRFRRYNENGTIVGSEVNTSISGYYGGIRPNNRNARTWLRSDGSFVMLLTNTNPTTFRVYDTANSLVATVIGPKSTIYSVKLVSDVVYVIAYGNNDFNKTICKFSLSNQLLTNKTLYEAGTTFSTGFTVNGLSFETYDINSSGEIFALVRPNDAFGNGINYYLTFDLNSNFVSATNVTGSATTTTYGIAFVCFHRDTVIVAQGAINSSEPQAPRAGYYFPAIQSVYGVAASSAAAGGNVKVQVVGPASVSPAVSGGAGFDSTANDIPGNKGIFGGSGAVLYGF